MSNCRKKNFQNSEHLLIEIQQNEILKQVLDNCLPCAVAFKIVVELNITPKQIGIFADQQKIKLNKCQMGLFGYPKGKQVKKNIKLLENTELRNAISNALIDGRLTCKDAWEIADKYSLAKMAVSNVCEAMEVRICNCQLGAF